MCLRVVTQDSGRIEGEKPGNRCRYLFHVMKTNLPASLIGSQLHLLDYIDQYPEEFLQTALKAARSQSGILRSVGLKAEEVPGMIYAHFCQKDQPQFPNVSAAHGYIYRCTVNKLVSIGRKNTTRRKLFDDFVDIHDEENFHGASDCSPAFALASTDEVRAILDAAQMDPMETQIFQCAHDLLEAGDRATTVNVAARLGLPYTATYRSRLNLQRRVRTALRNGQVLARKGSPCGSSHPSTLPLLPGFTK